jgi:hypothetical protein
MLMVVLLLVVKNQYTIAIVSIGYALWGALAFVLSRWPGRRAVHNPDPAPYNPPPQNPGPT